MDGLGVCPPRSQTRPPKAPKERLVGRATSAVVAVARKRHEINCDNSVVRMVYEEGRGMVMRGLRRVLVRCCDEVGKGQAVEATLENPEGSGLAGELEMGGPVHGTNYTRRQEWVPAALQYWGRQRETGRVLTEDLGASSVLWPDQRPDGVDGAGSALACRYCASILHGQFRPPLSCPFVDKCLLHSTPFTVKQNRGTHIRTMEVTDVRAPHCASFLMTDCAPRATPAGWDATIHGIS